MTYSRSPWTRNSYALTPEGYVKSNLLIVFNVKGNRLSPTSR